VFVISCVIELWLRPCATPHQKSYNGAVTLLLLLLLQLASLLMRRRALINQRRSSSGGWRAHLDLSAVVPGRFSRECCWRV